MSKQKGKFFLGAMFGAFLGAVAALLTAKKSGRETRDDLKNKANDLNNDARRQLRKLEGELNKKISDSKKILDKTQGEMKKKVEKSINQAQSYRDKISIGLEEAQKNTQKKLDEKFLDDVKKVLDELQSLNQDIEDAKNRSESKTKK